MSDPSRYHPHHLTLAQLQRVKNWHVAQQGAHPVERQVWEAVLTVWIMGWIGWLPAYTFEAPWAFPLCLLGVFAPRLYVHWRAHAHARQLIRCEWLDLVR